MQSILAQRRFGRVVKSQYERDCRRAEALNRANEEAEEPSIDAAPQHRQQSIDNTSSPTNNHELFLDAEKGDYSPADSSAGLQYEQDIDNATDSDDKLETKPTLQQCNSFGTRMGQALTGVEVRTLTREMTRTRSEKGKPKPDLIKTPERETVFVVGYESDSVSLATLPNFLLNRLC